MSTCSDCFVDGERLEAERDEARRRVERLEGALRVLVAFLPGCDWDGQYPCRCAMCKAREAYDSMMVTESEKP